MADLSPEAQRLLAQLRGVDDPTASERADADAAMRRMLAAHGVRNLPPLAASEPPVMGAPRGFALPFHRGALKLLWGMGAAAVLGALSVTVWKNAHTHEASAQEAPTHEGPVLQATATAATATVTAPAPVLALAKEATAPNSAEAAPAQWTSTQAPRDQPSAVTSKRTASSNSLAEELRFLASVDAEIRSGEYDQALRRLTKTKLSAQLQEERAAMRVLALCGRNHDAHAMRARDHFLRASPSSVLAARVRAACAQEDGLP